MHKKISPVVVTACLVALTALIFAIAAMIQNRSLQRAYGNTVRLNIYSINDLSTEARDELASEEPDPQNLLLIAGSLKALESGAAFNDSYHALWLDTAEKISGYASSVLKGDSASAQELLRSDAAYASVKLRAATQYVIAELSNAKVNSMNADYFDLVSDTDSTNRKLTTFINDYDAKTAGT